LLGRGSTQAYQNHPFNGDSQQDDVWAPLRIAVHYDDVWFDSSLGSTKTNFIKNKLIPSAVQWWSDSLDVIPVQGALTLERHCAQRWADDDSCAALVGLSEDRCGGTLAEDPAIPPAHFAEAQTFSMAKQSTLASAAGAGITEADFVLYVTALPTARCTEGGTLAYAGICRMDQFDRPIAGRVNFCPDEIHTTVNKWERQVATTVHELGHALGFSSFSFPFYRDPDSSPVPGVPRTPRNSVTNFPLDGQNPAACTSGSAVTPALYPYPIPSANTIAFSGE
jgi:leishmanolysin-like peptidase